MGILSRNCVEGSSLSAMHQIIALNVNIMLLTTVLSFIALDQIQTSTPSKISTIL